MSIVSAVVVKDRKIRFVRGHYRDIMKILDSRKPSAKKIVDAGYIVFDLDRKIVLNCQSAFRITDLSKGDLSSILSEWRVLDYANW